MANIVLSQEQLNLQSLWKMRRKRRTASVHEDEYSITCALRSFLSYQYPSVIMRCGLEGVRLPIGLAVKVKRLNPHRGFPDIMIFEPRGKYHGLMIELKRNQEALFTKSGNYRKSQHIQEQHQMLIALEARGYKACFATSFIQAKSLISEYLEEKN